jgi:hypothetical protein
MKRHINSTFQINTENTLKNENKSSDGEKMFFSPNKVSTQPVSHLGRSMQRFFLVGLVLFLEPGSSSEQDSTFLLFPPTKFINEKS